MGARSLDVPLRNLTRLPTLSLIQEHSRALFTLPPNQRPVFFHEEGRILNEDRWSSLISAVGPRPTLSLRLQPETSAGPALSINPLDDIDDDRDVRPEIFQEEPPTFLRTDYFAVQGTNGNTTLYLEKAGFDRRMAEFAREGSLAAGMRVLFPPKYRDEYTRLFHESGAGFVVTTTATALLKQWERNAAVAGGILIGGLAGGFVATGYASSSFAVASAGVGAMEGAVAGGAAVIATEATAGVAAVTDAAAVGSTSGIVGVAGTTVLAAGAAVTAGYLTYRGLQWLLPEIQKEPYTILMSVPAEDAGMLEIGRQMSMVESSNGPSCGICMDRPQNAAAIPCGHTACHACLEQMIRRHSSTGGTPCPHCRVPIQSVQRIYMQ